MSANGNHLHKRQPSFTPDGHNFKSEPVASLPAIRGMNVPGLSHWAPLSRLSTKSERSANHSIAFPSQSLEPYQNTAAHQTETIHRIAPYDSRAHPNVFSYPGQNHQSIQLHYSERSISSSPSPSNETVNIPEFRNLPPTQQVYGSHSIPVSNSISYAPQFNTPSLEQSSHAVKRFKPERANEGSGNIQTRLAPKPRPHTTHIHHVAREKTSRASSPKIPFPLHRPQTPSSLSDASIPNPTTPNVNVAKKTNDNVKPVSYHPPPTIPHTVELSKEPTKSLPKTEGEALFAKLAPSLETVNKFNFEGYLVEVLKECHHVPIDDLYNALYNSKLGSLTSASPDSVMDNDSSLICRHRELELCHLVVETFKSTEKSSDLVQKEKKQNPQLSSVNFHELLRSFLAMKVLSDTLVEVDAASQSEESLSRISVYKVYYILCQKLIAKYPTSCNSLSLQQNIILGQSKLGKLTRLLFPHLITKRLGKRGQSKSHYMGFKWNQGTVDKSILDMLDLDVPEIQDAFSDSRRKRDHTPKPSEASETPNTNPSPKGNDEDQVKDDHQSSNFNLPPLYQKPLYSFVDLSCRYPSTDCSPRILKPPPNSIPQQSKWAKDTMNRSVEVLKRHKIDLNPLIQNFNDGVYADHNPNGLSATVVRAIETLMSNSAPVDIYMHLYLGIFLLVFPMILASDQELEATQKMQLRACLRNCITKFGCDFAKTPIGIEIKSGIFIDILKKMISLSELASASVKSSSPDVVIKEIFNDIITFGDSKSDAFSELSLLEESFVRSAVISFRAYNFDILEGKPDTTGHDTMEAIVSAARILATSVMTSTEIIQSICKSVKSHGIESVTHDVPHQMFRLATEILHEFTLKTPIIMKLPLPVMNFMIGQTMNEVQNSSFGDFRKRDAELSKEMFKSWWIFSSMFQEYLCVMSEIIALSQIPA